VGEQPPDNSLLRILDLPAALTDARGGHGVSIDPDLALGSDVDSAAPHPVRIDFAAQFTNSDLLEATTAFLVLYVITSCDGHSGQHR
jgi:hypothetical protein